MNHRRPACKIFFWILKLLLLTQSSLLWAADSVALVSSAEGILKGLTEPIVGMHHLVFCLMTGFLGLTMAKSYRYPLFYLFTLIPGYAVAFYLPLPVIFVNVVVALSVAALLFNLWFVEKFGRYAVLILTLGGFFHGASFVQTVQGSSMTGLLSYLIAATLIQALLCFGFGLFTLRLSLKSLDNLEGLENILSATATGVFIAYIYMAF